MNEGSRENGGGTDDGGTRWLDAFLRQSIFFDYFCQMAETRYRHIPPHLRVHSMTRDHKFLWRACIFGDLLAKAATALILLVAAALVVWKTLAPVPEIGFVPQSPSGIESAAP